MYVDIIQYLYSNQLKCDFRRLSHIETILRCEMMMNHWILGCPIVRHNRVVERSYHENLNNHGFRSFEIDVSVYNSWSYANISPLLVESDINTC